MSSSCTPSSMPSVAEVSGPLRSEKPAPAPQLPSTLVLQWVNLSSTQGLLYNTRIPARILSKSFLKAPLPSPTMRTIRRSPLEAHLPSSTTPIHNKPLLKVPPPSLRARTSHTTTPLHPALLSNRLTTLATLPVQLPITPLYPRRRTITHTLFTVLRPSFHCLAGIKDIRPHNNTNCHPNLRMVHISLSLCKVLSITRVMF
jgi:hypothetical protein